jgi:threonine dehydratase
VPIAAKHLQPGIRVIAWSRKRKQRCVSIAQAGTRVESFPTGYIADGLRTRCRGRAHVPDLQHNVERVVLVTGDEIRAA